MTTPPQASPLPKQPVGVSTVNYHALLAVAALIYDAPAISALQKAGDPDLVSAALDPRFLAERHRVLTDNLKRGNEEWRPPNGRSEP